MRHIKIKYIGHKNGRRMFRITHQSHREIMFSAQGAEYTASNGLRLASGLHPAYHKHNDTLWVQGMTKNWDDNIVTVMPITYYRIKRAVAEYNATHGGM